MFKIEKAGDQFVIADTTRNSLHSNGNKYFGCYEYFPTKKVAKKVLDEYYPNPEHVWEHGDVFTSGSPTNPGIMMYVKLINASSYFVLYLNNNNVAHGLPGTYLDGAEFLFNIKGKI